MTDDPATARVDVWLSDEEAALELEAFLKERGAQEVTLTREEGILPIALPFIIGAVVVVGALFDFISKWRDGHACLLLIDARGDTIKVEVDCADQHGRVLVVTKDGTKAEITNLAPNVDLTKIGEAAIRGGLDAVKAAAEAVGGTVTEQSGEADTPAQP